MAEVIGVASGVAGLCTFAFQAGTALYNTIESYQSHQQRVLDLLSENGALNGVLETLQGTLASANDLDLSALEVPLTQCGVACQEIAREIETLTSSSGGRLAKLRGWARLRYMGEDIDGLRRLLAGYKMTITIALADANLQRSTLTSDKIEGYSRMIQTATADFEDRLQRIDERLENLVHSTVAESGRDEMEATTAEVRQTQAERLSTEKCLQICRRLSEHIGELRSAGRQGAGGGGINASSDPGSIPERITNEGLDECEESLSRMAQKLARHEKTLFTRLSEMMARSSMSGKNAAEVARLRDEWESTHRQMEVMSKAARHLEETVSVIQNQAVGDAVQIMVSVGGKPLRGTNRATGPGVDQVGGLMDNETVQTFLRETTRRRIATYEKERTRDNEGADEGKAKPDTRDIGRDKGKAKKDKREENGDYTQFEDLYGSGYTLECESPTGCKAERKN